ncbi:GvpL/GvpF family gas vesicle protein [Patescibacteria group bacterium]|nr:GvpL/GvpF family gas vesicle protein [Patescibacteria group bacterium]
MSQEGKYLYCIIGTDEGRNFGPIGIGNQGNVVSTIGYSDISGVISNSPMTKYVISRENLMAHEKVIEKVMQDYAVLPVRFCTIASSAEEIRSLLRKRYIEFKNLLRDMDNKIEVGIKAIWRDMNAIFQEIVKEDEKIQQLKERISTKSSSNKTYADKITLGKTIQSALLSKKESEGEKILNIFKKISVDFRSNKIYGDSMILNVAFLIDKSRDKEFDNQVEELTAKYAKRIKFNYVAPTPPFNFVNIIVKW